MAWHSKLTIPAVLFLGCATCFADGIFFGFGFSRPGVSVRVELGSRRACVTRKAVVIRRAIPPRRVWVPGRYVERIVYVEVPGRWEVRWVPPVVRRTCVCGVIVTTVVVPGHYEKVWVPPRRIPRKELVYVPGHYRCLRGRIDP